MNDSLCLDADDTPISVLETIPSVSGLNVVKLKQMLQQPSARSCAQSDERAQSESSTPHSVDQSQHWEEELFVYLIILSASKLTDVYSDGNQRIFKINLIYS